MYAIGFHKVTVLLSTVQVSTVAVLWHMVLVQP